MFGSLLLALVCGFAVAFDNKAGLDQHWDLWKKTHSKVYSYQVSVFFLDNSTSKMFTVAALLIAIWY